MAAGGYLENMPGEGGGGGVNGLFNPGNYFNLASNAAQSNGYIFIDYNRDGSFDQAWYVDGNGSWWTTGNGETWRPDDGPVDELMDCWIEDQR
jgi:hypothetical protein